MVLVTSAHLSYSLIYKKEGISSSDTPRDPRYSLNQVSNNLKFRAVHIQTFMIVFVVFFIFLVTITI